MPPPKGTPNFLEGPGDYDVTTTVHSDSYSAIDPTKVDFTGKSVFITGGSKGLGHAMVLSFAKAGASNIAAAARSDMSQVAKDVEAAALSAGRSPPRFLGLRLDVTNQAEVEDAAKAVEREFGGCDVVVNNAGIMMALEPLADSDPEIWWKVYDVNVRGAYLVSRAFLPLLLKSGGDGGKYMIQVSSVGAHLLTPTGSAYQASKLTQLRMSQFIDAENADKGVISFSIHPGNSPTDIMGGKENLPDIMKPIAVDAPELSADTLVYLTSEKRQWLGGRYVNVTWDMPELMAKEEEIVKGDKLKIRLLY